MEVYSQWNKVQYAATTKSDTEAGRGNDVVDERRMKCAKTLSSRREDQRRAKTGKVESSGEEKGNSRQVKRGREKTIRTAGDHMRETLKTKGG